MSTKKLISSGLGGSRKVATLLTSKENFGLIHFSLFLYSLGIASHDDFGQISALPEDWKYNIFSVSEEPIEIFKKALNYLVKVELLELSTCGKVLRYIDSDSVQYYRTDRPRRNRFPDALFAGYKKKKQAKNDRERLIMEKQYGKTKERIIYSYSGKKQQQLLETLEAIKNSYEEISIFYDMIEKGLC